LESAVAFERALSFHGACKHAAKDVDDALDATCLGVELVDGTHWCPPGARLWEMLQGVVDLSHRRAASPAGVGSYMGVAQWFDLLRRPKLATFERCYNFVGNATDWAPRAVPDAVMQELLVDAVFFVFGSIDMRQSFLPFVAATDASTEFGHGAVVAPLHVDDVRELARHSMSTSPSPEQAVALEVFGLELAAFEVVLSVRTSASEHINLEESKALSRLVRWILRSPSRFEYRVVILVDSLVVLGAVSKGRSSSIPLNRLLRWLAALTFASKLRLHLVYVPSKTNPADPPSRGGPATWPDALRKSTLRGAPGGLREERRERRRLATAQPSAPWKRLRECTLFCSGKYLR